jgi:hypothetical protein
MQVDVGLGVKIVGAFGGTYRVAAGLKLTACLRSEIMKTPRSPHKCP